MKGTEGEVKICLVDDANTVASYSAASMVTCGRCGVKADNATVLCEPGLHSDIT